MKILSVLFLLASICLMPIAPVNASLMTFDSAPSCNFCEGTYIEDGIKMSLVRHHFDLSGGTVQVDTYHGNGAIKFEMANGSVFNLRSLYLKTDNLPIAPNPLEYMLSFSNGTSISVEPGTDSIFMFYGFNDLSYFTCSIELNNNWDMYGQFNFELDNINMSQVPEPSTMLLLGTGLIGLAGYSKKIIKKANPIHS